jgi:hypothetical protein
LAFAFGNGDENPAETELVPVILNQGRAASV